MRRRGSRSGAQDRLCPPSSVGSRRLAARVARRTARRLGRMARRLARPPLRTALPGAAGRLRSLLATLRALPRPERLAALHGPELRGFLGEAEIWIEVPALAGAAGDETSRGRLFDRVSRTEWLVDLLPAGRIDARFPVRCRRLALQRLRHLLADLAAAHLGLALLAPRARAARFELEFREEPELGLPAHRIDLGTVAPLTGPLAIVAGSDRPRAPFRRHGGASGRRGRPATWPLPVPLRAVLRGRLLQLIAPGRPPALLPAAGSPLGVTPTGRPSGRLRSGRRGGGPRLERRPVIPGTSIPLAPALRSSPRRLAVGAEVAGLGLRLARAMRLVHLAWPEAHDAILLRTRMLVPVRESDLVSYSLASRPGVSYVNVFGKTILQLADDLLHETAHHLLHDLQEIAPLLRAGAATGEVQAFDSPWRGVPRPLHGVLHGTYTFLHRAELFDRILRAAREHRRTITPLLGRGGIARVGRERRAELRRIAAALSELRAARRAGLLTAAGRRLLGGLQTWAARLRRR
jgi:HEXXH motif-containing protein